MDVDARQQARQGIVGQAEIVVEHGLDRWWEVVGHRDPVERLILQRKVGSKHRDTVTLSRSEGSPERLDEEMLRCGSA